MESARTVRETAVNQPGAKSADDPGRQVMLRFGALVMRMPR